jgi:pectate lyase
VARSVALALVLAAALWGLSCQPARYGVSAAAGAHMPAFAGAEGFGRNATSWRGGAVVKVTNLSDRGPGSLRACAEDSRPRVCVFEVAGTIEVDSTIAVGSNVYLAGQTAPGDGVQLRLRRSPDRPMMVRAAHGVVIRHLRLRPGPSRESSSNVDAIGIFDSHDVILDHLSLQWATDELLDVATLRGSTFDITVQDSLLAWGLDFANHPKGKHSKGALICTMDGRGECGRISLLRNLFAHNRDRNPDVNGTSVGPVEIVNNVFYNPRSEFGEFYDHEGDLRVNYVGNTTLSGPSTRRSEPPYAVDIRNHYSPTFDAMIYVRDNIDGNHRPRPSGPEELVVRPEGRRYLAPEPFAPLTVEALAPEAALERVLASAGATAPGRDPVDTRVIEEVISRTGRVINDPAEVGGWPALRSGPVLADGDGDGMPDRWEAAHGSDPQAFDAWQDVDGNGWADLEDYLNQRADGAVLALR